MVLVLTMARELLVIYKFALILTYQINKDNSEAAANIRQQ